MRNIFCYNSGDFSLGRKAKTSLEGATDTHPHTLPLCLLMMFSHSDTIWTISKIHLTVFHCKKKKKKLPRLKVTQAHSFTGL